MYFKLYKKRPNHFSKVPVPFCIPISNTESPSHSAFPSALGIVFHFSHYTEYVVVVDVVLIDLNFEHIFMNGYLQSISLQ